MGGTDRKCQGGQGVPGACVDGSGVHWGPNSRARTPSPHRGACLDWCGADEPNAPMCRRAAGASGASQNHAAPSKSTALGVWIGPSFLRRTREAEVRVCVGPSGEGRGVQEHAVVGGHWATLDVNREPVSHFAGPCAPASPLPNPTTPCLPLSDLDRGAIPLQPGRLRFIWKVYKSLPRWGVVCRAAWGGQLGAMWGGVCEGWNRCGAPPAASTGCQRKPNNEPCAPQQPPNHHPRRGRLGAHLARPGWSAQSQVLGLHGVSVYPTGPPLGVGVARLGLGSLPRSKMGTRCLGPGGGRPIRGSTVGFGQPRAGEACGH